jgi:excisionase family DNA binding protein
MSPSTEPEHRATVIVDVLAATDIEAIAQRILEVLDERADLAAAVSPEQRLSVAKAAELADVAPDTLRRAIRAGQLPAYRAGTRLKVRHADLVAWMNHDPVEVAAPPAPRLRRRPTSSVGSAARLTAIEREVELLPLPDDSRPR